ncbi:MAG: 3'(2'),5'-bisphosphate nucleotidase CysQ [Gammaproteobacteria bacterium]|jgi:3'(2'), 5'-bisphosphate nucleotidase|nr:3'(2'),5'-bisphosphate nucleotidase CysQ [Gammaproteobacteria bacterium]MBU2224323.1 3'(2'),5'-bisphosphate nucleotidase CysQ [Gammaproteobacteria bacterium]MBU2277613.1 3'(2'),5'-bisphosphate nucleotidase CysQ [Gammaproteobacteria bacterium]MBU2427712.1 3'(2'),5'-bisphosphate nucleotidase CysQ [Gammaproteobacteria bacterium]
MFLSRLLEPVKAAAREAGETLWQMYQSGDYQHSNKADDSPVTTADYAANQIIIDRLSELTPDIPIISEESNLVPLAQRQDWPRYWLIDPMDGTQEFVARSGDFAVSIALVEHGWPALGVIFWPKEQICYYATRGNGAFKQHRNLINHIKVRQHVQGDPLRIAVSRRQPLERINALLASDQIVEYIPLGSCSLKSCLVAEGGADCYLRLGPTGEWDTGAVHIIVEEAGGKILDSQFSPLSYNQRESLANPDFMVMGKSSVGWQSLILAHNDHR